MTLTVTSTTTGVRADVRGAEELLGAAVTVRLPTGCSLVRALPGALLQGGGAPLTLAGPRADGAIVAAATLKRGDRTVSGDGTVLLLETRGASCASPATLLSATGYDAAGTAQVLPVDVSGSLPGSGPGATPALLLLCAAGVVLLARGVRRLLH